MSIWYYGVIRESIPQGEFCGRAEVFSDERRRIVVSGDPNYVTKYQFIIGEFRSKEDAEKHATNVGHKVKFEHLCPKHQEMQV